MKLTTSDFDYDLPPERIAQHPPDVRGASRLLRLDRDTCTCSDHVFSEVPSLLQPSDVLVLNDTRVIPARFFCRRQTGARIEGLFLRETDDGAWEVLLKKASRCRPGEVLSMRGNGAPAIVLEETFGGGRWRVRPDRAVDVIDLLTRVGTTPLPPYIARENPGGTGEDRDRYQTVYARTPGAVAAPTAGLHFTDDMLRTLTDGGIELVRVTLHVGFGTFSPVKTDRLAEHAMHAEWYKLDAAAADGLSAARAAGRRIIAVGTTAVRVLETAATRPINGTRYLFSASSGWTDIFIYPPYEFSAVDAMITNFHLPRSTLLMLVAAFCSPGETGGVSTILHAYRHAIAQQYRFYSYGDAMLIE